MSDLHDEQNQGDEEQGETPAPPTMEPISPPQPDEPPADPVGRTPEAEQGQPPSDESQGVGVAPTQDGDSEDGTSGTAFQTTEQIEGTAQDAQRDDEDGS